MEGVIQGLLAMAIDATVITISEGQLIIRALRARNSRPQPRKRRQGGFFLDLDLAVTDRDAAQVDSLVDRFEEMTVFNEFTNNVL